MFEEKEARKYAKTTVALCVLPWLGWVWHGVVCKKGGFQQFKKNNNISLKKFPFNFNTFDSSYHFIVWNGK